MNKYEPHDYDASIPVANLHIFIDELKQEVNGLLDDSAKDQREIELLREALGNKL